MSQTANAETSAVITTNRAFQVRFMKSGTELETVTKLSDSEYISKNTTDANHQTIFQSLYFTISNPVYTLVLPIGLDE